ncbi:hypothetical protein PoB_007317400, partial [Plakobranchus ocellatus]
VFHCVHFESPADTSVGSLINSVTNISAGGTGAPTPAGFVGTAATAGPPNSPRQGAGPSQQQHHQQGPVFPGQEVGNAGNQAEGQRSRGRIPLSHSSSSTASNYSEGQQNHTNYPPFYGPTLPPVRLQQHNHQLLQHQEAEAAGAVGGVALQAGAQANPNNSPPQGLAEPIDPGGRYVGHMLQQDAPEADWMDIR